jgi:hypothetical protein
MNGMGTIVLGDLNSECVTTNIGFNAAFDMFFRYDMWNCDNLFAAWRPKRTLYVLE